MNDNEIYELMSKSIEENVKLDFSDVLGRINAQKNTPPAPAEVMTVRRSAKKVIPVATSLAACFALAAAAVFIFAFSGSKRYDAESPISYEDAPQAHQEEDCADTTAADSACDDCIPSGTEQYIVTEGTCVDTTTEVKSDDTQAPVNILNMRSGQYQLIAAADNEHLYLPTLTLDIDGMTFSFYTDMLSSYICTGSLTAQDDVITCHDSGSEDVYRFLLLDSEHVAFIAEGSSTVIHYNDTSARVEDGSVFEFIETSE